MKLFGKVLIANRGEIAVRIIRACRELGIRTVAVHSDVEREALHVRLADESVCIGPARSSYSYLNIPAIISAAEITDSEAIHPGYGFLAENPQFAEVCRTSGIRFIGPEASSIRQAGDKARARRIMKEAGVPVVPGSEGPVSDEAEMKALVKEIGLPVIIKATAGGGGRGMRVVERMEDLVQAFQTARQEALSAFGNGDVYVEKFISRMRHVEVQVIADQHGRVVHLGERDCSIQRRHQKLIEESPSPVADEAFRERLGSLAVRAAEAFGYTSVGTVEFIVTDGAEPYFMEMNTRVQVEHPVTEMVTGVDIIREQIRVAAGQPLSVRQDEVRLTGHSIECRINAEDPERFVPSPGMVRSFIPPGGPGVRVDTAVFAGWEVSPHYDSMIAKLVVHGADRTEAILKMRRALAEFVIDGIQTTIPFHQKVIASPLFASGEFGTDFLERFGSSEAEK